MMDKKKMEEHKKGMASKQTMDKAKKMMMGKKKRGK